MICQCICKPFLQRISCIRVVKKILSCGRFRKSRWLWEMVPPPHKQGVNGNCWTNSSYVKMKYYQSQARDKEKIWVPDRIRTYNLPNTWWKLYPLELRRTHGEQGQILGSYSTCILHTARISNVNVLDFVNKNNLSDTEQNSDHKYVREMPPLCSLFLQ